VQVQLHLQKVYSVHCLLKCARTTASTKGTVYSGHFRQNLQGQLRLQKVRYTACTSGIQCALSAKMCKEHCVCKRYTASTAAKVCKDNCVYKWYTVRTSAKMCEDNCVYLLYVARALSAKMWKDNCVYKRYIGIAFKPIKIKGPV
jgi:hypothetical protein